ncbi:MAG: restriction endonuclease subunit S, partial [Myxococcota bacterium]
MKATPRGLEPYPAYKDSGVEWLGEIPAHWELNRTKFAARLRSGHTPSRQHPEYWQDCTIPWFGLSDVWQIRDGQVEYVLETAEKISELGLANSSARLLPKDTVILSRTASVGFSAILGVDMATTQDFVNWICGSTLRPEYLLYVFRSMGHEFRRLTMGSTHQTIYMPDVGGFSTAIPPLAEQDRIVAHVREETARIDELVAKKERLIGLLQEQRTALITRAVTKGLDPNVPMKDSGVECLGQIPAHWNVNRTKFAARLRSGHTPSRQHPEYWQDCTIPWFGLADVWQIRDGQMEYVYETTEKISELGLASSAARLLPKGTVILSRTASVGFSTILGVDMATTQDFVNWVCGPTLRPEYLLYTFRSMRHEFRRLTMGSTHQTIYMPDVGTFSTPIPPVPEQDEIIAVIRREATRIDALVAKIRDAIDRLKELRTALISAAVTGKI